MSPKTLLAALLGAFVGAGCMYLGTGGDGGGPVATPSLLEASPVPSAHAAGSAHMDVYAESLGLMMKAWTDAGATLEPKSAEAFRKANMDLFCRFDLAMNSMTVAERQSASDILQHGRDVLVGKNHLEVHGCPLPHHLQCPGGPEAPK